MPGESFGGTPGPHLLAPRPPQAGTGHQAFFSFLPPHSLPATRPSSFPQSHAAPRVTTSRNEKTSSRYCSYQGCWKAWGLRCAAPRVCRMWLVQPTRRWAGLSGWERRMALAASTADLYLSADRGSHYSGGIRSLSDLVSHTLPTTCTKDSVSRRLLAWPRPCLSPFEKLSYAEIHT